MALSHIQREFRFCGLPFMVVNASPHSKGFAFSLLVLCSPTRRLPSLQHGGDGNLKLLNQQMLKTS